MFAPPLKLPAEESFSFVQEVELAIVDPHNGGSRLLIYDTGKKYWKVLATVHAHPDYDVDEVARLLRTAPDVAAALANLVRCTRLVLADDLRRGALYPALQEADEALAGLASAAPEADQ